jgi:hypothetical protein
MMRRLPRSARRAAGLIAVAVALGLLGAPGAWAATPSVDIHSAGPLSDIYIGNDLSCQVRSGGFSSTEFFPNAAGPGDCGTFLFINADGNSGFLGPDFGSHAGGTHTTGNFAQPEMPFTPISQSLTGSGTPASPYRVTTVVSGADGTLSLTFTEVDTYVVGNNFWSTDVTVENTSASASFTGELYHAADCQLRGNDNGFGEFPPQNTPNAATCTPNVLGNPASALEQLVPISGGSSWEQTAVPTLWADLNGSALADSCLDCRGTEGNNGIGIEWPINNSNGLAPGQSQTLSFQTVIVDTVPAGGFSLNGPAGSAVGGTVATITDPNTSATPGAYSATINWGDGSSSAGTISAGNGTFNVTGSHAYAAGGTYPIGVTITSVGTSQGSSTVNDTATITAPPASVVTGRPPSIGGTTAAFTGSVDPNGLPTTASFQYGLDPKYTGAGPLAFTRSTPAQAVGSDFTSHAVSASVGGLVPNALYHVRLVATNSAGTTIGPDVTFTTHKTAPPGAPTVGKTFNLSPVSGVVLILVHGQLVPLTELQQIPKNTLIDALHGTLNLTTALPGGGGAHDAAAKGKKRKRVKTQSGRFGGAIFKIAQARNGLATLTLVEGAVKGGPSYGTCKVHRALEATAAAARTLQLLRASAHGKFRTKGRYSAATVRGTKWTVADRCDGTLTHDITHSVAVTDFVRHKTIVLHAGQSYLAKARKPK